MIAFICLFFPPFVLAFLFECLSKRKLSRRGLSALFAADAFLVNGGCFLAKYFLMHSATMPLYDHSTDMLPGDVLCYMGLSIVVGAVLLLVQLMISFSCKVSLESTDSEQPDVEDQDEKETE